MAVRLILFLDDPDAPHSANDGLRILAGELELGGEDQWLVEVGVAIGEAEVVSFPHLDDISRVENGRAADELADCSLAAAGVAPQGTADRARYARQNLEAGQSGPGGMRDQGCERDRGPGLHHIVPNRHVREEGAFEMNHERGDPFVANQDVRSSPQNLERDPFLPASLQESDQLVKLTRTGKVRGGSSQTEPNQRSQRLVEFHGPTQVVK